MSKLQAPLVTKGSPFLANTGLLTAEKNREIFNQFADCTMYLDFTRDLSFVNGVIGAASDAVTTSRASAGSYTNSQGVISDFSSNNARIGDRGLLVEKSVTNLSNYSEDMSHSSWTKANITITANIGEAPDGETTADSIGTIDSFLQQLYKGSISVSASTNYVFSFYAKRTGGSGNNPFAALYDESNASFIALNQSYTITDEWQRFDFELTTPAGCTSLRVYPIRGLSGSSFEAEIWGVQVEQSDYVTSYIKTEASTATRADDVITVNNFSSWFTQSQGTVFIEQLPLQYDLETSAVTIDDGTNWPNTMRFNSTSSGLQRLVLRSGNVQQADVNTVNTYTSETVPRKTVFSYQENDVNVCLNGGAVANDTSATMPVGDTRMLLGRGGFIASNASLIQQVAYFDRHFSDEELQRITG